MIDIRQLTIGSHILVGGKRERVRGLDEDNGLIIRFPAEYVSASEAESISLTPELLTELGFEFRDLGFAELWKRGDFDLEHKHHSVYWECKGGVNIEFLHELENLYYLIYETELIPD